MKKPVARLLVIGAVVSVGVLVAACGGPSTPGVASLSGNSGNASSGSTSTSSTSGTSSPNKAHVAREFGKCMRKHGVRNFPEGPVTIGPHSGIDPNSPTFQAAQKACQSLLPKPSAAQIAKIKANALKYSKCMRKHGVTNFPDPTVSTTGGGIGIRIGAPKGSLDPNSPTFQAAQNACGKILGLPKGGPGKGQHSGSGSGGNVAAP
jgi:hypothetical protein